MLPPVLTLLLHQVGLPHWQPCLSQWLARYAGLEQLVDPLSETPHACVIRLLRALRRSGQRLTDDGFASQLAQLDFLLYRVRRRDAAAPWNPLQQPLPDYWHAAPGQPLAWKWDVVCPAPLLTRLHLLRVLQRSLHQPRHALV